MDCMCSYLAGSLIGPAFFGVLIGAASFLWCRVLTAPGMIANIVPVLYYRHFKSEFFAKPLFECPVCNSFWLGFVLLVSAATDYTFSEGFGALVAALFSAYVIDRKYGG